MAYDADPSAPSADIIVKRPVIPSDKFAQIRSTDQSEPGGMRETGRTIETLASEIGFESEGAFIASIEGKTVLDVGSGWGWLAKEVMGRKIKAEVYSVNPRLSISAYKKMERDSTLAIATHSWHK